VDSAVNLSSRDKIKGSGEDEEFKISFSEDEDSPSSTSFEEGSTF
jgi:hypothetical protein